MARRSVLFGSFLIGALMGGCATVEVVDPPTALNGRELTVAVDLYGQWDARLTIGGEPQYLWRRAVVSENKPYVCELRAFVSLRNVIRKVTMEGFPEACALFSVQYASTTDNAPAADKDRVGKPAQAAGEEKAKPGRRYRPVGR
jgi:hypothetical protein